MEKVGQSNPARCLSGKCWMEGNIWPRGSFLTEDHSQCCCSNLQKGGLEAETKHWDNWIYQVLSKQKIYFKARETQKTQSKQEAVDGFPDAVLVFIAVCSSHFEFGLQYPSILHPPHTHTQKESAAGTVAQW